MTKERVILLQKQISIAKTALLKISRSSNAHQDWWVAQIALDNMEAVNMGKTHAIVKGEKA